MELRDAFGSGQVVSVVGAGGKKSTLYALANSLDRAVVTATVRIPLFDEEVAELRVTDSPQKALRETNAWPLGVVPARDGTRDRYVGYDRKTVDELAAATDVPILIKADGARTRLLKAPNDEEPQVPPSTDLLVPIASVRAVGKPLDPEYVHRPERVSALTGLSTGERIEPADVVTVISHDDGGLKGSPDDARVVPLLNMVDDGELRATARSIATDLLKVPRIERVVLGRMNRGEVVEVVS